MNAPRLPALAVLVGLLIGLVLLGRTGEGTTATFGRPRLELAPTADARDALTSTWYCAAGTAARGALFNATVVVTNAGDQRREGTITWMPTGGGERTSVPIELAPNETVAQRAVDHVTAPTVSALVEVDGGGVAVEHAVSGPRGTGVAPCASEPSARWYLANGVTERDAGQDLVLFNPFPDDAIVDVVFSTDRGRDEPRSLQGLPVAAGTTKVIPLQDVVRRRAVTATSVVARTGRLVVDRIQSFDGTLGRTGVSLALAAPALADVWEFPDGLHQEGIAERWHVYNPGTRDAEVSLELLPATGDAPEPYDVTIPARTHAVIEAAAIERVPAGLPHASTIRSLNDVPVVAERSLDARRPGPRRGWSSALGSPVTARRWVFPVGEANQNTDEWIVVRNPGSRPLRVSLFALIGGRRVPIEDSQGLRVRTAGRLAVRLGDHISRTPLPVLVEATRPIVAERDAYGVLRLGLSTIIGIPVP